ncbi:MAG: hypothetical protein NTX59_00850 [Elusimicrobia bacterium]|nr:hypothetical protein [Elusimicrobiota bacterium]
MNYKTFSNNKNVAVFLLALLFVGCSHVQQGAVSTEYLEAIGMAIPPKNIENRPENKSERKMKCRDAAIVQAQFEMLSVLKGVRIEGGITVNQAITTDSTMRSSLSEVLRGATIENTKWEEDDSCAVTLRIPKNRIRKMMGIKF